METESSLRLMTVADVVKDTGLPKNRVYEMVKAGEIPHVPIGGRIYFRRSRIETRLDELEEGGE